MKKNILLIVVLVAIAALIFNFGFPGAIIGGTIESVSKTTLNNRDAFLITALGGSGADGITAEISRDQYPNWNADKSLTVGLIKVDDKYTYTLTERVSSLKTVNTLNKISECVGNNPLDANSCSYYLRTTYNSFDSFKSYCRSLNANGFAINSGADNFVNNHWTCYAPTAAWVVGDFNRVGGIYEPKVSVNALTYQRGTRPWLGEGEYEKIAELQLDRTTTQGLLVANNEVIGEAKITSMAPTFTSPPSSTAIKAISRPTSPRNFVLTDGDNDLVVQNLVNTFNVCQQSARRSGSSNPYIGLFFSIPLYEDYTDSAISSCINSYNAGINDLANNNPVTGDFARSDIGLDVSKINSDGKVSIKNSFALPKLTMWIYAESVGVVRSNAVPSSVSCTGKTLDGGVSSILQASVVNGATPGTLYWSASCSSPVSTTSGSGQVSASANGAAQFSVPISTGTTQGTSTCTVTAKSTDLTQSVSGTCTVNVRAACNVVVPSGCHLVEGCQLDCTVPPSICSDGTVVGACNFNRDKRCVAENGVKILKLDPTCATPVPVPAPNSTLSCLPIIQKPVSTTVGGNYLDLIFAKIYLGGGQTVQSCETDYVGVVVLLVGAFGAIYLIRGKRR